MRWVILSQDRPAALHAVMESAGRFKAELVPNCLVKWTTPEAERGYGILSGRFRANWTGVDNWKEDLLTVLMGSRRNGSIEPTTLISTDTQVVVNQLALKASYAVLQDRNVLGVDYLRACDAAMDERRLYLGARAWVWESDDGFRYGVVYRTTDLLTILSAAPSLDAALLGKPLDMRRTKMACFSNVILVEHPILAYAETQPYLENSIIDIGTLTPHAFQWQPSQGG